MCIRDRPEPVQHDVTAPMLYIDERRLPVELRSAKEPAGQQWVARRRIAGHGRRNRWIRDLECRPILEPDRRHGRREPARDRVLAFDLDRENGSCLLYTSDAADER